MRRGSALRDSLGVFETPELDPTKRGETDTRERVRSSYKEHMVDALAPGGDEGRDYLRKATESWK